MQDWRTALQSKAMTKVVVALFVANAIGIYALRVKQNESIVEDNVEVAAAVDQDRPALTLASFDGPAPAAAQAFPAASASQSGPAATLTAVEHAKSGTAKLGTVIQPGITDMQEVSRQLLAMRSGYVPQSSVPDMPAAVRPAGRAEARKVRAAQAPHIAANLDFSGFANPTSRKIDSAPALRPSGLADAAPSRTQASRSRAAQTAAAPAPRIEFESVEPAPKLEYADVAAPDSQTIRLSMKL